MHSKKKCLFEPKFVSNMNKPKCWVKNAIKNGQLKMKVEVGLKFEMIFLTQYLGLSIFT